MRFKNRAEAGKKLAEKLEAYKSKDLIILALPRGGVVLGYKISKHLEAPLDLIITRKIGHPQNPEYAVCSVSEDGRTLCNEEERSRIDKDWLNEKAKEEQKEARRRRELYLDGKKSDLEGKTVVIVDDGVATGLTLKLAIKEVKREGPAEIIVAVPVVPKTTAEETEELVDELVALDIPEIYMGAVEAYYEIFNQVSDEEVIQLLENARTI